MQVCSYTVYWGRRYIHIFMFCPIDSFQIDQFELYSEKKLVGRNIDIRIHPPPPVNVLVTPLPPLAQSVLQNLPFWSKAFVNQITVFLKTFLAYISMENILIYLNF